MHAGPHGGNRCGRRRFLPPAYAYAYAHPVRDAACNGPRRDPASPEVADHAPKAIEELRSFEHPSTRRVEPTEGKPDHMAEREAEAEDRQEALLDEAVEETFPGSDPISPKHIT